MSQDEMFLVVFLVIVSPIFLMGLIFSLLEMIGLVQDIMESFRSPRPFVRQSSDCHYNEYTLL